MTRRELRRFRKAAGRTFDRACDSGTITNGERTTLTIKLLDDDQVERMAAACTAQAVECGVLSNQMVAAGNIKWVGLGENIDWKKLAEFILKIIPMFL